MCAWLGLLLILPRPGVNIPLLTSNPSGGFFSHISTELESDLVSGPQPATAPVKHVDYASSELAEYLQEDPYLH